MIFWFCHIADKSLLFQFFVSCLLFFWHKVCWTGRGRRERERERDGGRSQPRRSQAAGAGVSWASNPSLFDSGHWYPSQQPIRGELSPWPANQRAVCVAEQGNPLQAHHRPMMNDRSLIDGLLQSWLHHSTPIHQADSSLAHIQQHLRKCPQTGAIQKYFLFLCTLNLESY